MVQGEKVVLSVRIECGRNHEPHCAVPVSSAFTSPLAGSNLGSAGDGLSSVMFLVGSEFFTGSGSTLGATPTVNVILHIGFAQAMPSSFGGSCRKFGPKLNSTVAPSPCSGVVKIEAPG
eukprot:scaffold544_cov320-Pavlova_lutheri.AAC.49